MIDKKRLYAEIRQRYLERLNKRNQNEGALSVRRESTPKSRKPATEEQRAKWRERKKRYYQNNKEHLLQKEYARKKRAFESDPDLFREKWRSSAEKRRARAQELINEYQRKHYAGDPNGAAKQNDRRQQREPYRIIRAAERLLVQGSIDIDECLKRIDGAVEASNQLDSKVKRRRGQKTGGVSDGDRKGKHGNDGASNPNKGKSS